MNNEKDQRQTPREDNDEDIDKYKDSQKGKKLVCEKDKTNKKTWIKTNTEIKTNKEVKAKIKTKTQG